MSLSSESLSVLSTPSQTLQAHNPKEKPRTAMFRPMCDQLQRSILGALRRPIGSLPSEPARDLSLPFDGKTERSQVSSPVHMSIEGNDVRPRVQQQSIDFYSRLMKELLLAILVTTVRNKSTREMVPTSPTLE